MIDYPQDAGGTRYALVNDRDEDQILVEDGSPGAGNSGLVFVLTDKRGVTITPKQAREVAQALLRAADAADLLETNT